MTINAKFMMDTFVAALAGIPVTLQLTFVTLLISSPFAFAMAMKHLEERKIATKMIAAYVSFIRGTPIVLHILFLYSLLPTLLNYFIQNVCGLSWNVFKINPIFYAYVVFVLNTTATLSEVFRSALQTVPKGQMEAALTVGLSKLQAYVRIIIPQAIEPALPNICNTTIALLKSTSLAFLMSVQDITAIAKVKAAYGYNYIEAYLDICIIYIIICSIIQLFFYMLEKSIKIKRGR